VDTEAQQLAQALLNSGESSYTETFSITKKDEPTGEEIVIIALKIRQGALVVKSLTESIKAIVNPSGQICPMCQGTGRI
jgi:hypothetical protein